MRRGFTFIEIIIVIIVVGVLAAVGLTQYSRTVEKSRGVEARMAIGQIRQLAYDYNLTNGSFAGLTLAGLNIGSSLD